MAYPEDRIIKIWYYHSDSIRGVGGENIEPILFRILLILAVFGTFAYIFGKR